MPRLTLHLDRPLDLGRTLWPHLRGLHDPAMRVTGEHLIRATRTADGPATIEIRRRGDVVEVEAWGPGADRAIDAAPAFIGIDDDRSGFAPANRSSPTSIAAGRASGSGAAGPSSRRSSRRSSSRRSPASRPGAACAGSSPGGASRHPGRSGCGSCRQPGGPRGDSPTTRSTRSGWSGGGPTSSGAVAARANRFEEIVDAAAAPPRYARLRAMPGIGPWTAAEVARPGARRPGRGQRRRLPPAEPRGLRARRRAEGDRRADARAARAVPRPSRPGGPAPRGERDPARDARSADAAPLDRRDLAEYTKPGFAREPGLRGRIGRGGRGSGAIDAGGVDVSGRWEDLRRPSRVGASG